MAGGGIVAELGKLAQLTRDATALVDDLEPGDEAAAVGAVQALVNTVAELARQVVVAAQRDRVWASEGWRSPVSWLAAHTGLPNGSARALQHSSVVMAGLRHARLAALDGVLNDVHVRRLVEAKNRGGEHCTDEIDAVLTDLAASGDLAGFAAARRAFLERVDAIDSPDPAALACPAEQESFRLAEGFDGWWNGELHLSPEHGRLLASALDREVRGYLQRARDGDPTVPALSVAALRAQGLMDLVDGALRVPLGQASSPDRCHITLTVRLDGNGRLEPDGAFPEHYGCDASFTRQVLGAESEPLDIGRAQRRWPRPLAHAVVCRDRGCRFPGCDQPPSRCDIHHCQDWTTGGPTTITNGVLLCRHHHTFIHRHRWTIELDEQQRPIVRKPDGVPHQVHPQNPRRAAPP